MIYRKVYVVYLGEHDGSKTWEEIEEVHHSYLLEESKDAMIYSYKNSINGFSAFITPEEAAAISGEIDQEKSFTHNACNFTIYMCM